MAQRSLEVYCFFDAAGAAARAATDEGASGVGGAGATVGWVDLGNPQT